MPEEPSHAIGCRPQITGPARAGDKRGEAGAILVLALVFLLVTIIIVGSLASGIMNDLNNSNTFKSVRSLQYAERSTTDLAIQMIRYTPLLTTSETLNASPPSYCWGNGPVSELNNIDGVPAMAVWCSTAWTPTSADTRTVTFSTCPGSKTATQCAAQPSLQAVVSFDDYPAGVSSPSTAECVVFCGTTMAVDSWVWNPVVPTVSAISPSSGPITGGASVTITGTGFVTGTTVSFIEESGGTPVTDNVVLPATGVTVNGPTSLTVAAPAATEGTTYFVTVTTATGNSAYSTTGNDVFTYSLVAPTITGVSPASGGIAGGSSVTITGTGFYSGATVSFVQESGGSPVIGGVTAGAAYVSVTGSTTITAVSPAVISPGTYFVTVTTPAGTTATGASDVFTYSLLVPIVSSLSPASGPIAGGTAVTISGTGFVSGDTVSFTQESGYSPVGSAIAATGVTVVGSSTITVSSPAVASAGTYFVTVTTPGTGMSSYFPIYTYSS
jgi:hypothetical protein